MKLPKDRPINDYLRHQYETQDTRIRQCGLDIREKLLKSYIPTVIGTIASYRFTKHNQNI